MNNFVTLLQYMGTVGNIFFFFGQRE